MKLGQLIEENKAYVVVQNYAENEAPWRLVPDLFLFS